MRALLNSISYVDQKNSGFYHVSEQVIVLLASLYHK